MRIAFRLVLFIAFFILELNSSIGAETNNLQEILKNKALELEQTKSIDYEPNKFWFKSDGSVIDPPPNDFRFTLDESLIKKNISYMYFFDMSKLTGYLQIRGGVTDTVNWYGPFNVTDEMIQAIEAYRCEKKL